ncbi:MAG: DNA recombination protein RmuC [Bacteroidales bacterium]
MADVLIYALVGLVAGAIIVLVVGRFIFKPANGQPDVDAQQRIIDAEGDLRIANDRLERAVDDNQRLHKELIDQTSQKEALGAKFSSLTTLLDETQKQQATLQQDYSQLKEELKIKVETFQELNRKYSGLEMRSESQQEQISNLSKEVETLKSDKKSLQEELSATRERAVELDKENKYQKEMLDKQKLEIEEIGKKFSNEFKLLADSILEDKSKRFTELNQTNIERLLKPLGENISVFQKKVEEVYDRESKERFSLGKEVEKLVILNKQISEEANNLTNALKGQVKQQGNWGEMILESILEKSGLSKGREYHVQESFKDDGGKRYQPDVIISYPDDRQVVIDSKVSLVAYERYCSSTSPEEQEKALNEHLRSIRIHIDTLSGKSYQDLVGSLDFVMMFVPVEPAFMLAMQTDSELWNYAYSRRVLLISPTNLIAALKMIFDLWQREYQNRHAIEIADRGGKLYDKFVSFVESLTAIGDSLTKSQNSYEAALKQLTSGNGNLVAQAQKIKNLGAKARKSLPDSMLDSLNDEPEQLKENE